MSGALLTVMVYDVADDKRRRRIHALLKQYGAAMQERGVFPILLTRPS